jgi:hypothetical protein
LDVARSAGDFAAAGTAAGDEAVAGARDIAGADALADDAAALAHGEIAGRSVPACLGAARTAGARARCRALAIDLAVIAAGRLAARHIGAVMRASTALTGEVAVAFDVTAKHRAAHALQLADLGVAALALRAGTLHRTLACGARRQQREKDDLSQAFSRSRRSSSSRMMVSASSGTISQTIFSMISLTASLTGPFS